MSDEKPNYQKLVDPHPPPYDIFFGYRRWEDNAKPKQPDSSQTKPKQCVCPPAKPKECQTEPRINVYVHLLPGNGGRKIRHFTPEKFKSAVDQPPVTNRKTPFQISGNLVKDGKTVSKKSADKSENAGKIRAKEIQRASSCDCRKSSPESRKTEKEKKSEFGAGKTLSAKDNTKNKSWDHFRGSLSAISSKGSLAQRVKRKKLVSELDLSSKALEKDNYKALTSNETNQFNVSTESSKKTWNKEQLPEKSISFQYLQFPIRVKELCKSLSMETRSLRKNYKNSSILEQYKNSLTAKLETPPKPDRVQSSLWRHSEPSDILSNFKGSRRDNLILNRSQLRLRPGWTYPLNPQYSRIGKGTNPSREMLTRDLFKSDEDSISQDDAKRYNNQSWNLISTMKKNVKICQCPHFHTDEGIRKVCLQSSQDEQEYGQKFFRVNYIPKEEVNDSSEEKEYANKGTTTDDMPVTTKSKITRNEEGSKAAWLKTKTAEMTKKDIQRYSKPRPVVYQNQKRPFTLGETPKSSTKYLKSTKQEQVKEKESKNVTDKAASEVVTLRKLFAKLEKAERVLKKEKCPKSSRPAAGKTSQREKVKEKSEADTGDEFEGHGKDLKVEIVRHVRSWLDSELNGQTWTE